MADARILIVEDEAVQAMDLQQRLVSLGYPSPEIAYSGEEALARVAEMLPDLVLMDIMMPGEIDGVAAADRVRTQFGIPVIYVTAYADPDTVARARITEPYGYLVKPFQDRDLQIAIEMAMYRHEMELEVRAERNRYRELYEFLPHGYLTVGEGQVILEANRPAARLVGRERRDLIGSEFGQLVAPESRSAFSAAWREIFEGGTAYELKLLKKDGTAFDAQMDIVAAHTVRGGFRHCHAEIADVTERKRAQEALAESEERYRSLVNFAPEGIIVQIGGKLAFGNPAAARMLGLSHPDQLTGMRVADLVSPEYQGFVGERIRRTVEQGQPNPPAEMKLVRVDGSLIDVESISIPFFSEGRRGTLAMLRDISERKRAQEALAESEERYRSLVELANDAIVVLVGGKFVFANPAAARMLGRSRADQLVGMPVLDVVHPDYWGTVAERIRRTLEEGSANSLLELKLVRADGSLVEVSSVSIPFVHEGERGTMAIVRDITLRKEAERAVRESEERFRGTLGRMLEGCQIIGHDWRYLYVNDVAAAQGRRPKQELLGRTMMECYPGIEDTAMFSRLQECMRNRVPHRMDNEFTFPDGSKGWFELSIEPVPEGVFVLSLDITERKRAEERLGQTLVELSRSNRDLEQFAYAASHDLQEPLRMVTSFTQLLEKRYKGQLDKDADEFIGYVVDGATRMREMINGLLAFSRVTTRGAPFEPVESEALLSQATANLMTAIEESSAVVTHDPLPPIVADAIQMAQLFQNLVGNAIKFRGEEAPRVHVSASRMGEDWVFSVRDNGIGIAPEFHERVFGVFERLHTREQYPGTGIGLSICKKIVERHGGRIWVESQPGMGATFHFTLPAAGKAWVS